MSKFEFKGFSDDTLLGGKVKIRQPKNGFRATIDAVLLAASVPAGTGERILELGVGSGGASLCLCYRVAGSTITGIDINPELIALAKENIKLNGFEERVEAKVGNVATVLPKCFVASFHHVILNPPYLPRNTEHVSPNLDRAIATKEGQADLKRWIKYAHDSLLHKGRMSVIHRADRLNELIQILSPNLGAVSIFPLWPREGVEAKRVIVQARKGVKSPCRILTGLTLHNKDGSYTDETKRVLKGGEIII